MNSQLSDRIKDHIRDVEDFPKKGIVFKDITPIFANPELCNEILEGFISMLQNVKIDAVACMESRGFFFGMLLAQKLKVPFIPIRKKGKLPYKTLSLEYQLEYGTETIEIHQDAILHGSRVLVHDDVLATGGTAIAASQLVLQAGGQVAGFAFLLSLGFLGGNDKLQNLSENIFTLAEY